MAIHGDTVFSELANVMPIYCSGLAYVIVDGGNLHFALYQETVLGDGSRDRVIMQRIIMPARAWMDAKELTLFEIEASGQAGVNPADFVSPAHA